MDRIRGDHRDGIRLHHISILLAEAGTDVRTWRWTYLTWISFPSSFLTVPIVNRALVALDVENIQAIDLTVAAVVTVGGYLQWFWFIPMIWRRFQGPRSNS
jgi:hypothetical protein